MEQKMYSEEGKGMWQKHYTMLFRRYGRKNRNKKNNNKGYFSSVT